MEILNPLSSISNAQTAFSIPLGKQITLHAKGLAGDDKVFIEILELSKAPEFNGNPCCTFYRNDIQVIARTPLLCPDGRPAVLSADYPVGTLDAPQNVTLGVRVEADDAATVTIELYETESDGCLNCVCDRPCVDEVWTPTGVTRCTATEVEAEEKSNCGTARWVVVGPVTWTETGAQKCEDEKVFVQEANDCGTLRWVEKGPQTWTETGVKKCEDEKVFVQEVNDCGALRWVDKGAVTWSDTGDLRCGASMLQKKQTDDCCCNSRWVDVEPISWTDTGLTRCNGNDVEKEQRNQCGATKWVVTGPVTWTDTGASRCNGADVEKEQRDQCGNTKWVVTGPVTWTDTGASRCKNNLVEMQEVNDCGTLRWTATVNICGYCPSYELSTGGFAFIAGDAKDPAATVAVPDTEFGLACSVYPTPRSGATAPVKVNGVVVGYAQNKSDCGFESCCE